MKRRKGTREDDPVLLLISFSLRFSLPSLESAYPYEGVIVSVLLYVHVAVESLPNHRLKARLHRGGRFDSGSLDPGAVLNCKMLEVLLDYIRSAGGRQGD